MKNYLLLLTAFIVTSFSLISCKGGSDNDPKAVAKNFFEALKTMNLEEAAKYATKESKSMLDLMKMGMSMAPTNNMDSLKREMDKQKITYSDPVITGDEAVVTVTVNEKDKTDFKLKKEDGLWKVAFDKNSLMNTGKEKMHNEGVSEEDMQEARDAMESLDPDSLKKALDEASKLIDSMKQ